MHTFLRAYWSWLRQTGSISTGCHWPAIGGSSGVITAPIEPDPGSHTLHRPPTSYIAVQPCCLGSPLSAHTHVYTLPLNEDIAATSMVLIIRSKVYLYAQSKSHRKFGMDASLVG